MANIYTEQQVGSYAHDIDSTGLFEEAKRVENYSNQLEQQAQNYENKAKKTYANALEIEATDTMNSLYEQFKEDPVGLEKAFNDAYSKVSAEIVDDDVKVDFTAKSILKKQVYMTKAIENKKKADYRRDKSITYMGIDKNTQTIGEAFSTLLGGDFNPDNVAVYGSSMAQNEQMINKLNEDGTFMFTDEQRKQKYKDIEKAHLFALESTFDDLEAYKKNEYVKRLEEDNVLIPVGVDNDSKEVVYSNLKDVVSWETYKNFKDHVQKTLKNKSTITKNGLILDDDEAWAMAEAQTTNSIIIENNRKNVKELLNPKNKDASKLVEGIVQNLELQDNVYSLGFNGLSETDFKKYRKELVLDLIDALKQDEDSYDDAVWNESVMSTGLQVMKNDGNMGGDAWADEMSVVMIRDFYQMAKENGIDLRATDSGSREAAKKLAIKAIGNTMQRKVGGYNKEYNSIFLNGRRVSKSVLPNEQYTGSPYTEENGKKIYNETGIEVEL